MTDPRSKDEAEREARDEMSWTDAINDLAFKGAILVFGVCACSMFILAYGWALEQLGWVRDGWR